MTATHLGGGRQLAYMDGICLTQEQGKVTGAKGGGRQLGEETDTAKPISGHVFRLILPDDNTNEIAEHHMAHNVTGLPNCSNCSMSIAFSNAQECTKETHDEAMIIPSLSDLRYSTNDDGNSAKHNNFIADSEHPVGKQFLSYAENMYEDPTQVQDSKFSVFFYDKEGELVACSFLQPILSEEEKELAAEILAIITAEISSETEIEEDGATPIGESEGGNSAGSLMLSFLPIVVSAAACVFFSS